MQKYNAFTISNVFSNNDYTNRVRIKNELQSQSVIIPYINEPGFNNPALDTAIEYLTKKGYTVIGTAELSKSSLVFVKEFTLLKERK